MTDLLRLRVSLTKHGAHKIAQLMESYNPDKVIGSVRGKLPGVNIDAAQARGIISVEDDDKAPRFWHEAKKHGEIVVRATTLLAIIFSHHRLIAIFRTSGHAFATGIIHRRAFEDTKEFTNLKDDIRALGFSVSDTKDEVDFNFRPLLNEPHIPAIAAELFRTKLLKAGWHGHTALVDECVAQGFHHVLSLSENQFREWLSLAMSTLPDEDREEQLKRVLAEDGDIYGDFKFQSGHRARRGHARKGASSSTATSIELAHNQLQTKLHKHLCEMFGEDNIGTEKNRVDVVRKEGTSYVFYELKVGLNIRSCIREAVSQLLEYAYWPDGDRAARLVIVAPCSPTAAAQKYLALLRSRFGLPIYYQQIDGTTGALSKEI